MAPSPLIIIAMSSAAFARSLRAKQKSRILINSVMIPLFSSFFPSSGVLFEYVIICSTASLQNIPSVGSTSLKSGRVFGKVGLRWMLRKRVIIAEQENWSVSLLEDVSPRVGELNTPTFGNLPDARIVPAWDKSEQVEGTSCCLDDNLLS